MVRVPLYSKNHIQGANQPLPTIHIPADIYNTMSSYSEHLLGLRNLIKESSEWLVAIPFPSSHWIQDTKGVVSPTLFSSSCSSMVNLVHT